MKFILCNRDESHTGGDMIQLRGYQKALKELGHEAVYLHPNNWYRPTKYYDEAWIFHCNFDWTWNMYRSIKESGVPFRMIPIFYKGLYVNTDKKKIYQMISDAKSVHCLSSIECNEMIEELELSEELQAKMFVIPNGVDEAIFNYEPKQESCLNNSTYVVSTGRLSSEKGFHYIIEACKKIQMPVVIIGAKWDAEYRQSLLDMGYGTIIDELPQEQLCKVLKDAAIYVCAAENERNNLSLIEGIACGAKPISSLGNRGNEWFPGITIIDPKNIDSLASAIKMVSRANLSRPAYQIPSWKDIVQMILRS